MICSAGVQSPPLSSPADKVESCFAGLDVIGLAVAVSKSWALLLLRPSQVDVVARVDRFGASIVRTAPIVDVKLGVAGTDVCCWVSLIGGMRDGRFAVVWLAFALSFASPIV